MSETFVALIVALVIAIALPIIMVGLSALLGPKRPNPRKLEPFESGISATIGTARERFSIKFYLVAILFIVFDVEGVFMYPWAVNFRGLGLYGLIEMFIFIGVLFAGFIYIVKKGALKWD
jgi:NADH-quinone oxidoreductase subunit A